MAFWREPETVRPHITVDCRGVAPTLELLLDFTHA